MLRIIKLEPIETLAGSGLISATRCTWHNSTVCEQPPLLAVEFIEHDGTHKRFSVCAEYAPKVADQMIAGLQS